MESPSVSIVMPVYNAGGYLRETVASVQAQTFRDFELILVDDGSTDGSAAACDAFAAEDSRVRVLHQANGGICRARNAGLAAARGTWLAFSDHDDRWEPDYLETALAAAARSGAKIVKVNHQEWIRPADGRLVRRDAGVPLADCAWDVRELFSTRAGYFVFQSVAAAVWDGLYDRAAVAASGVVFDETLRHGGEDCRFMACLLAHVPCGVWVARPLYHHYHNVGFSTSARCHLDLLESYLETALLERTLFPEMRHVAHLSSFLRWAHGIIVFVFGAPDCPLSRAARARWVDRYFRELAGGRCPFSEIRAFSLKHRILLLVARLHLYGLYQFLVRA